MGSGDPGLRAQLTQELLNAEVAPGDDDSDRYGAVPGLYDRSLRRDRVEAFGREPQFGVSADW